MQGVPAALISAAAAIPVVSFSISVWTCERRYPSNYTPPPPAPRLRHLTLVDTGPAVPLIYDFLLHPRNPAYTQQIERLRICIDQDNASYAGRIIAACAASLKYLAINLEDITRLPPSAVCPGGRDQGLGRLRQAPSGFILPEHLTDCLLAPTHGKP
ncbi:hypothetical protein B0H14DRAFT_1179259 [Mycena olivaceomarginata]|nr:hypothetical protein B0H14DRAFT_1179259 [Mycena olivaceomarginata]